MNFLGVLQIQSNQMINLDDKLGILVFVKKTLRKIYEIKNHSICINIHGEIEE